MTRTKLGEQAVKKILLIATGGTIASSESEDGLAPAIDADQLLSCLPEIRELCEVEGVSVMNIDSTNMTPGLMAKIAETIHCRYGAFEGFVVTHGTDTLAYTAAGLTYMLQGIGKPVVMTGSQFGIRDPYTDARVNVCDAVRFALEEVSGVFVAFDGLILNGTRALKLKTRSLSAFVSVNSPFVATVRHGRITYEGSRKPGRPDLADPNLPPVLNTGLCEDVFVLKIHPGLKPDIFDFLKKRYRGVVIEGFGMGGIPSQGEDMVSKVAELLRAGVAVVISTQCLEEGIDLGVYRVGREIARYEVINSGDMTTQAAVMKLMWALANLPTPAEVKKFMEAPVCGDRSF